MNITPDLTFLHINKPFTNEGISVYLDKHSRMSLDTKDYFVKHISHLSKGVVIVASAWCHLSLAYPEGAPGAPTDPYGRGPLIFYAPDA